MAREKLLDRREFFPVALGRLATSVRFNGRRVVQAVGVPEAADEPAVVHHLRHVGQVLADREPGNGAGNGLKLTPHGRRGVGLHVVGVEMAGPAIIEEKNAGLDGRRATGPTATCRAGCGAREQLGPLRQPGRLGRPEPSQRQRPQPPPLQKSPPGEEPGRDPLGNAAHWHVQAFQSGEPAGSSG